MLSRLHLHRCASALFAVTVTVVSGCAKQDVRNDASQTNSNSSASESIVGSWKRVDPPLHDYVEAVWLNLRFASDGKLTIRFQPGIPSLAYFSPERQKKMLEPRESTATYEQLADGKMRIESGGDASIYTFENKGKKLYLTPPATELGATPGSIYLREDSK